MTPREIRELKLMQKKLDEFLSEKEYYLLMVVYLNAINRMENEDK